MGKSEHMRMRRQKWGIRDEVFPSVQFFIHPQFHTLYLCSQYLGSPEVLRLGQTNLVYPLLQSNGASQVHCTAGVNTWSNKGERRMTEVENAGSTARTGLALLRGWGRQSCCVEGHVPPLLNKGARDCRRGESFSSQSFLCFSTLPVFHLAFFPASWSESGISASCCSGASHMIFICIVDFLLLRVSLLSAPELKIFCWYLLSPLAFFLLSFYVYQLSTQLKRSEFTNKEHVPKPSIV